MRLQSTSLHYPPAKHSTLLYYSLTPPLLPPDIRTSIFYTLINQSISSPLPYLVALIIYIFCLFLFPPNYLLTSSSRYFLWPLWLLISTLFSFEINSFIICFRILFCHLGLYFHLWTLIGARAIFLFHFLSPPISPSLHTEASCVIIFRPGLW